MRLKSLILYLKLHTAKDIVINKINFFLNLCVFLIIFAITSTFISIYFEYKINEYEKKINSNNLTIDIASLNLNLLPKNINTLEKHIDENNKTEDIIDYVFFSKIGGIFTQRDRFYLPAINLVTFLNKGFADFVPLQEYIDYKINNKPVKDLKVMANNLIKQKKEYDEILEQIKIQHDIQLNKNKNIIEQDGIKVITNDNFYKEYEKYNKLFKDIANNQINFFTKILAVLRDIVDQERNNNIKLREKIALQSQLSSNFVLGAFSLQLFVFFVIQILEYQTTKREVNAKRKN